MGVTAPQGWMAASAWKARTTAVYGDGLEGDTEAACKHKVQRIGPLWR
jgi:hypothetical protein